jgi:TonB family protein
MYAPGGDAVASLLQYARAVVTTHAFARAASWLVSAGLHVVAFVAAGHPSRPSADARLNLPEPAVIDLAPDATTDTDPMSEAGDRAAATANVRLVPFVPPPTHTHPYPVPPDHDAHPHDPSLVHLPFALSPPPQALVAAPLAPARFAMKVTNDSRRGPAVMTAPSATRLAGEPETGGDAAPLPEAGVSSPARLATPMSPAYPAEARAQQIEADVALAIVVASTGEVVDARVLEAAGFGFDQEALRAVRAARFIPAEREGRRVAVRMRWSVSFRLR